MRSVKYSCVSSSAMPFVWSQQPSSVMLISKIRFLIGLLSCCMQPCQQLQLSTLLGEAGRRFFYFAGIEGTHRALPTLMIPTLRKSRRVGRPQFGKEWAASHHSHHIQLQSEHAAVALEVLIRRENLPVAEFRNCAKQKVNCRPGDAAVTAAVMHRSSGFIIASCEHGIIEGAQIVPQLLEALLVANARQQLLAHNADQLRPAVADQL